MIQTLQRLFACLANPGHAGHTRKHLIVIAFPTRIWDYTVNLGKSNICVLLQYHACVVGGEETSMNWQCVGRYWIQWWNQRLEWRSNYASPFFWAVWSVLVLHVSVKSWYWIADSFHNPITWPDLVLLCQAGCCTSTSITTRENTDIPQYERVGVGGVCTHPGDHLIQLITCILRAHDLVNGTRAERVWIWVQSCTYSSAIFEIYASSVNCSWSLITIFEFSSHVYWSGRPTYSLEHYLNLFHAIRCADTADVGCFHSVADKFALVTVQNVPCTWYTGDVKCCACTVSWTV